MTPAQRLVLFAVTPVVASACVTINIYFPAAAAEKAADRIIEEVWQLKDSKTVSPASRPEAEGEKK